MRIGVAGSAATYELTKRGQRVLMLEQHDHGAAGRYASLICDIFHMLHVTCYMPPVT